MIEAHAITVPATMENSRRHSCDALASTHSKE